MVTSILYKDTDTIDVQIDGDKDTLEREIVALMINALDRFTPDELKELIDIAVYYREEERADHLPPVH